MRMFAGQATTLAAAMGLVGCATIPARLPPAGLSESYPAGLVREYDQLARIAPKRPFENYRSHFRSRELQVEQGDCLEPEALSAWSHAERVKVYIPDMGGEIGIADLRGRLLTLDLAAQALSAATKADNVDLETARAHLLGRFDCIIVLGRSAHRTAVSQVCADEFASAARYITHALGLVAPPDVPAEVLLCPMASPSQNQRNS